MRRPQHLFPSPGQAPYQPPTGVSKVDSFNASRPMFQPKKKKAKRPQQYLADSKKAKKEVRFQLTEDEDEDKASFIDDVQLLI